MPSCSSTCSIRCLRNGEQRDENLVNDVNDTIAGLNVGFGNSGIIHGNHSVGISHIDSSSHDSRDFPSRNLGTWSSTRDNVIQENALKFLDVLRCGEESYGLRWQGLECRVWWGCKEWRYKTGQKVRLESRLEDGLYTWMN